MSGLLGVGGKQEIEPHRSVKANENDSGPSKNIDV